MIRVLVTGGAKIKQAGVATIVYAFGSHMHGGKAIYDYLMPSGISDEKYRKEILDGGGQVFEFRAHTKGKAYRYLQLIKWYSKIIKQNHYRILHINCDTAHVSTMYMIVGRLCGIKNIIVHSHSTKVDETSTTKRIVKTILHYLSRPIVRCADYRMACSKSAAEWMFGRKYISRKGVQIIHNGIEVDNYVYNSETRIKYRQILNLNEKHVIGCVGRLAYQKNPEFLMRAFSIVRKEDDDARLVYVGDGPLLDELKKMSSNMGIASDVLFLGNHDDVPEILQAFDVFALPSRFEGLGIVYIEAQAAGLPCFATDAVPKDAAISSLIERIPITETEETWASKIQDVFKSQHIRKNMSEEIKAAGYSINDVAEKLEDFYCEIEER